MNDSVAVKQADVVLLTYPLDYGQNYTADDKSLDLDYVSLSHPAIGFPLTRRSMQTSNRQMDQQ